MKVKARVDSLIQNEVIPTPADELEPTPQRDIRLLTPQSAYKRALIEAFLDSLLGALPNSEGLVVMRQ